MIYSTFFYLHEAQQQERTRAEKITFSRITGRKLYNNPQSEIHEPWNGRARDKSQLDFYCGTLTLFCFMSSFQCSNCTINQHLYCSCLPIQLDNIRCMIMYSKCRLHFCVFHQNVQRKFNYSLLMACTSS